MRREEFTPGAPLNDVIVRRGGEERGEGEGRLLLSSDFCLRDLSKESIKITGEETGCRWGKAIHLFCLLLHLLICLFASFAVYLLISVYV